MLLSKTITRRAALLGLVSLTAACGFQPVYGPGGAGDKLRGTVQITTPETVDGYRLNQHLSDRLGEADQQAYILTVSISVTEEAVAITADQQNTRFNLPGVAHWVLSDSSGATVVAQGQVDTFTSYSATGTVVATRAAHRDARDRLMAGLADLIVARLLLLPELA